MDDSMISYQDKKLHMNRRRIVKVRSYPGATSDDLIDFCKPIACRHPDVTIVHVGTNDLRHREEKEIAQNIMKIKETIKEISLNTKTLISLIIQRIDNKSLKDKACIVNHELIQLISKHDLIDNSNLDRLYWTLRFTPEPNGDKASCQKFQTGFELSLVHYYLNIPCVQIQK